MNFGSEVSVTCVSTFSTPLIVHAQINISHLYSGAGVTPVYEYTSSSRKTALTVMSMTTITTGLAVGGCN
jgi:hypothetical protein